VLQLEDVSKSYPQKPILRHTSANIERGDKIALIGANGKGKSTLLRIIAGTEPIEGRRQLGYNVNFSVFAQHQLEALNVNNTMLEELKQAGSEKTEAELRTILGCFLFSNDDVFKKVKVLSRGEKSRVALAKTLISEANFLLLDEPTNHLDMQSVNILSQALEQYEGTYVVISHDRHFVSRVANKIWYIEDYQIKAIPGTYKSTNGARRKRKKGKKKRQPGNAPKKAGPGKAGVFGTKAGLWPQLEKRPAGEELEKQITELENARPPDPAGRTGHVRRRRKLSRPTPSTSRWKGCSTRPRRTGKRRCSRWKNWRKRWPKPPTVPARNDPFGLFPYTPKITRTPL
jgi:ATP-binding cassette subfamily F protein 3